MEELDGYKELEGSLTSQQVQQIEEAVDAGDVVRLWNGKFSLEIYFNPKTLIYSTWIDGIKKTFSKNWNLICLEIQTLQDKYNFTFIHYQVESDYS